MSLIRLPSTAPKTEPALGQADAFVAFDDQLVATATRGVLSVFAPVASWAALGAHVERRAAQGGRRVLEGDLRSACGEPWRAVLLGHGLLAVQAPGTVAAAVAAALADSLIVVHGARETAWGRALLAALSALPAATFQGLVVTFDRPETSNVGEPALRVVAEDACPVVVCSTIDRLTLAARDRFWGAVVAQQSSALSPFVSRIEDLEAAWRFVRANGPEPLAVGGASVEGLREEIATQVDPWARMCVAELAAERGDAALALERGLEALASATVRPLRQDLWLRLEACLLLLEPIKGGVGRLVRLAEVALEFGESDRAERFAMQAMRGDASRFDVVTICGRAATARGEWLDATLWLRRALRLASTEEEQAKASASLAETLYFVGNSAEAEVLAARAWTTAGSLGTRLAARNVLGKLLLAKESWAAAEEHFAADGIDASVGGLVEEELRARLNRAVAVLSMGRRDEARKMFAEIHERGQALGSQRARAYALSNLAAIAILDHRYEEALDLSERAILARREMGERVLLVLPVTNLAELRLRLGLVREAAEALRFGIQACGEALPSSRRAYFSKMAVLLRLERGELVEATRELGVARALASTGADHSLLGQLERLAVRIALESGDLVAARVALMAARNCRLSPSGQAEVAWLEAELARGSGEVDALERVLCAVQLAEVADDAELLREVHILRSKFACAAGDAVGARASLLRAAVERERVATGLSPSLRQSYLARPRVAAVAQLLLALDGPCGSLALEPPESAPPPGLAPLPERRSLIGESASLRGLLSAIQRVARTHCTVLVHGPTGSGKELVAEALHAASARAKGPIVKLNCAAMVDTLLLSELFGHERGAFTGATTQRKGRFELASGGTLFLDEIGDISPRTQVALLRVLEDGSFQRVGGNAGLRCDVRVVCATHRDLPALVARGEFREDLYFRLCGVTLTVPALRDRLDDLPELCAHLLARVAASAGVALRPLTDEALRLLAQHDWPGNVRELENVLRAASVLGNGNSLDATALVECLPALRALTLSREVSADRPEVAALPPNSLGSGFSASDALYAEIRAGVGLGDLKRKLERDCIARALGEAHGNITHAAELLGMKRSRLSQLAKEYRFSVMVEDCKK